MIPGPITRHSTSIYRLANTPLKASPKNSHRLPVQYRAAVMQSTYQHFTPQGHTTATQHSYTGINANAHQANITSLAYSPLACQHDSLQQLKHLSLHLLTGYLLQHSKYKVSALTGLCVSWWCWCCCSGCCCRSRISLHPCPCCC